ncbi:hypothetical protein [Crateriforma conspicua]|uniref:Uncharacterized protein n=1 Tax=Crateriforma conspicua TaxID=2527996 RepID=A0A5C5XZ28_9PLAN|nr:hypothetical protein [Crateriforma conspicua]TWT68240.1 hypothetical protein Pan14r_04840 [Crateriforma conspicua]
MTGNSDLRICPLCSLFCDQADNESKTGNAAIWDCWLAKEGLRQWSHQVARFAQSGADLAADFAQVRKARPISVEAIAVDQATAQALIHRGQNGQIQLSTVRGATYAAISDATVRDGVIRATLGDVAAHADVIWALGDLDSIYPRWRVRCGISVQDSQSDDEKTLLPYDGPVDASTMADVARRVREIRRGERDGQTDTVHCGDWIRTIAGSQYLAVCVAPDAFATTDADLTAVMLLRLIRFLNESTRAVLVTLDAAATLDWMSLTMTNRATRTSDHDGDAVDIRLVGHSVRTDWQRPAKLQIGGIDPGPTLAKQFQPASLGGLHGDATVIRGDSSVALGLTGRSGDGLESSNPSPPTILDILDIHLSAS